MKLIIDIILVMIVVLCAWSGYRKGVMAGVAGILAVIIALLGGMMLSEAFSAEIIPALEPFVNGFIDSTDSRDKVIDSMGFGNSDKSLTDLLAEDSSLRYDYAYECMKFIGIYDDRAETLAEKTVIRATEENIGMTDAVVDIICETTTYVATLSIGFLMILILMVAIANVFNISMRLPNMENFDELGGLAIGFAKGFLYCILLCWLLSFLGLIIGKNTIEGTTMAQFFLTFDFVTKGLI